MSVVSSFKTWQEAMRAALAAKNLDERCPAEERWEELLWREYEQALAAGDRQLAQDLATNAPACSDLWMLAHMAA